MKSKHYTPTVSDKINSIAGSELSKILKNAIIRDNNLVECFGYYQIVFKNNLWQVTKYSNFIENFESLRIAVSWCIADKSNEHVIGLQIKHCNKELLLRTAKLNLVSQFARQVYSTDKVRYEIAQNKLSEIKFRLRETKEQLNKLINQTKYIQIKGFNNEPPRLRKETDSKITKNG